MATPSGSPSAPADPAATLRAEVAWWDHHHPGGAPRLVEATRAVLGQLEAAEAALRAIGDTHQPMWASDEAEAAGKEPIGCSLCYPSDGRWPCSTRMEADDALRRHDEAVKGR